MDAQQKKILKVISLELRHLLEGHYDSAGTWHPGDLEQRLAAIGVRRDREPVRVEELPHLAPMDRKAREVVDAYLALRGEAGAAHEEAVAEFVRETAYTWANRLLALRCMEARELVDEVIYQKAAYGGRSLEHHRLAQRHPELCAGEDDGLLAVLDKVFADRARHLPMLFDPDSPGVALKPSAAAIKRCMAILSESRKAGDEEVPTSEIFKAPDAFGWAYQYWNTEEKDRVFEKVRTQKGAKIEGADIIPATQLYTEPYMVKFLVQNSLGATWMGMHPESKLCETWEYYVRDADRAPVEKKSIAEITFLDPACGSGHFLLEAFDLFYEMYEEEMKDEAEDHPTSLESPRTAEEICEAILTKNLFGIDIDARAVQIAEVALWMKAAERAFGFEGRPANLVAAVASHLKGPLWEEFLGTFRAEPSIARVLRKFGEAMEHIGELGSLARPDEDLRAIIREEHATWERQVRERKEANYLFAEMAEDKLSGQLPFHEVSDEQFGERMLHRVRAAIHGFTERARDAGAFQDQFLGSEATVGFKLLDVLGRKYDVVAANPPYMGSKNMNATVKSCLTVHYTDGKTDLFAAFILRCIDLASQSGRAALVVPQLWMALKSYADLRVWHPQPRADSGVAPRGLLIRHTIELLVQLGRHAFAEADPPANVTLLQVAKAPPTPTHRLRCLRISAPRPSDVQAALLRRGCSVSGVSYSFSPPQHLFLAIPGTPVTFWLGERFLRLLTGPKLEDVARLAEPSTTGDNLRFVRAFWEVREDRRWRWASRGGGYSRWDGFKHWKIDWEYAGARMKSLPSCCIRNAHMMFMEGLTYTEAARGSLGVRLLSPHETFAKSGPGILPRPEHNLALAAVLNARVSSFILRTIARGFMFSLGNLAKTPIPISLEALTRPAAAAYAHKKALLGYAPTERGFRTASLVNAQAVKSLLLEQVSICSVLLTIEGMIEYLVCNAYGLNLVDIRAMCDELGLPASWRGLVVGHEVIPETPVALPPALIARSSVWGTDFPPTEEMTAAFGRLEDQLRSLKEDNGYTEADDDTGGAVPEMEDEETELPASIPVRDDTFVERVSRLSNIHPLSVYWLLKEGMEQHGWRCVPEEQRLTRDRLTVLSLQLLGYRWPMQIEGGELVPNWADPDGIIPVTEVVGENTIFDRVIETDLFQSSGLGRETAHETSGEGNVGNGMNSVLREFAEIMGKPLDQWLATEFFKHHTSQFKKRPIAWQIQSGKFTARRQPAFACLVYYHKLDGDLLPKIRTQYVGPLRQRMETELRGIEAVAPSARSERQQSRESELGDLIKELQDFDALLGRVQECGFETKGLRESAVEDAILCMKARWLARLGEAVTAGPLSGWKNEAAAADINENLPGWIDEAFGHLDYQCSRVGPAEWKSADDATPRTLAAAICEESESMVAGAVEGANQRWWGRLDEEVLAPRRREMSQKRERLKVIGAERKHLPPESEGAMQLEDEERRLKGEIKELKDELERIKDRADALREMIAGWRCPEAAGWEPWLARQPMYDAISSVDGHRQPPATVAEWVAQERSYVPDINDGVRVNIAPVQKAGLLAADVLAKKDLDKAIADRAEWRADERRWCREGKLPRPGWWLDQGEPE